MKRRESLSVVSDSFWPHGLYSPWNSSGQNTGVLCHSLSRGSSQPRDWTQVSHIAGGFFTSWVTREAHSKCSIKVHNNPSPGAFNSTVTTGGLPSARRFWGQLAWILFFCFQLCWDITDIQQCVSFKACSIILLTHIIKWLPDIWWTYIIS